MLATGPALAQYQPGASAPSVELPGTGIGLPQNTPGAYTQPALERRSSFSYFVGLDGTLTSNANFDSVRNDKRADFVTQISPGFRIEQYGAHSFVIGSVVVPILLYARTSADNNRAVPDVNVRGGVDAFDRHFTLDASVDIHRQFLTPLGATPGNATSNTLNEYSAGTYRLVPALRGDLANGLHYELHDANIWTNIQGEPGSLSDAYTNEASFSLTRDPAPLGWGFSYLHQHVNFTDQLSPALTTEIARLHADYQPLSDLQLSADVGYENNHYSFTSYEDVVYGAAVRWRPSERTSLDAGWEHRFFGSAWNIAFRTRTPLTVWSVSTSRDVSTYPQQLASFGAGQDINALLNSLFASRIADPVARQQAINNLIQLYGLPSTLTVPVQLYSQQARLITDSRATAGFVGSRNNVYFTIYRNRNQQVVQASDAAGLILPFNDTTQTGSNFVWSTRLAPIVTLTGIIDYNHATDNSSTTANILARTNNFSSSLTLSTPISALTDFHVGLRYQFVHSNITNSTDEAAIYAGILHRFR